MDEGSPFDYFRVFRGESVVTFPGGLETTGIGFCCDSDQGVFQHFAIHVFHLVIRPHKTL